MRKADDFGLTELLEMCNAMIERDFAPCGLREQVINRIGELFAEWYKRHEYALEKGKTIGGYKVIFYDLLRLVELARANSKRYNKPFCEYLKRALEKPYHEKGGLGYYSLSFWK